MDREYGLNDREYGKEETSRTLHPKRGVLVSFIRGRSRPPLSLSFFRTEEESSRTLHPSLGVLVSSFRGRSCPLLSPSFFRTLHLSYGLIHSRPVVTPRGGRGTTGREGHPGGGGARPAAKRRRGRGARPAAKFRIEKQSVVGELYFISWKNKYKNSLMKNKKIQDRKKYFF